MKSLLFVAGLLALPLLAMLTVEDQEEATYSFDDVHTASNPYCGDSSCWCHLNSDYHEIVIAPGATEEEIAGVFAFLELEVPEQ